jgi:ring-1,2-phenylacetyl-CoA epoxidase subunit PaaA
MVTDQEVKDFVAKGGIIESADEMSEGYLRMIRETLRIVADTEIMGAALYYGFLRHSDMNDRRFRQLLALIQDEIGHAHVHYRLLEDLGGGSVEELLYNREYTEFGYPFAMDMPIENWAEVALIGAFQDRAGAVLLMDPYHHTSFGPWKRTLAKVEIEERFHVNLGISQVRELAADPETKKQLQRAADWMFPITVEWFGVPDHLKKRKDQIEYRIRKMTNDQLRQEWLSQVVPLCEEFGIQIPAHYDQQKAEYVLDYPFPCEFDIENKRWLFDKPVTWDDVRNRWKGRGPTSARHIGYIQEEYKKIRDLGGL